MKSFDELSAALDVAAENHDQNALRDVLTDLEKIDTLPGKALSARARAIIARHGNDYDSSIRHLLDAKAIYVELGDSIGLNRVNNGIGTAHYQRSEYEHALSAFMEALAHAKRAGRPENIAGSLNNIANVYNDMASFAEAIEYYNRALDQYNDLHNLFGQAQANYNLGIAFYRSGNYATSMAHFDQAQEFFYALGNTLGQASVLNMKGSICHRLERYSEAVELFQQALSIYTSLEHRRGVAKTTANLGNCHQELGENERAAQLLTQAIELHKVSSDTRGVNSNTLNLIQAYISLNNYDSAERALQELDQWPINDPILNLGKDLSRANIMAKRGEYHQATSLLVEIQNNAEENGYQFVQWQALVSLQGIAAETNDLQKYIRYSTAAQQLKEQLTGKETVLRIASQDAERRAAVERHERERERALLYGALPESVAKRLLSGEKVTGDQYDNVAVIFLDIVGFTVLSDKIPASDLVNMLSKIFTALDVVCKEHGVTKIKTIGDSYMAVSFASVGDAASSSEHMVNAAHCALAMFDAVDTLQLTTPVAMVGTEPAHDPLPIRVRLGVHCGPVTAGVIGTERLQYDVWGDTVNVASRMESSGEPGRIHISDAMARALSGAPFHIVERGTITVKGKGEMTTHWLEGAG